MGGREPRDLGADLVWRRGQARIGPPERVGSESGEKRTGLVRGSEMRSIQGVGSPDRAGGVERGDLCDR
jgi:hypothetical protein